MGKAAESAHSERWKAIGLLKDAPNGVSVPLVCDWLADEIVEACIQAGARAIESLSDDLVDELIRHELGTSTSSWGSNSFEEFCQAASFKEPTRLHDILAPPHTVDLNKILTTPTPPTNTVENPECNVRTSAKKAPSPGLHAGIALSPIEEKASMTSDPVKKSSSSDNCSPGVLVVAGELSRPTSKADSIGGGSVKTTSTIEEARGESKDSTPCQPLSLPAVETRVTSQVSSSHEFIKPPSPGSSKAESSIAEQRYATPETPGNSSKGSAVSEKNDSKTESNGIEERHSNSSSGSTVSERSDSVSGSIPEEISFIQSATSGDSCSKEESIQDELASIGSPESRKSSSRAEEALSSSIEEIDAQEDVSTTLTGENIQEEEDSETLDSKSMSIKEDISVSLSPTSEGLSSPKPIRLHTKVLSVASITGTSIPDITTPEISISSDVEKEPDTEIHYEDDFEPTDTSENED